MRRNKLRISTCAGLALLAAACFLGRDCRAQMNQEYRSLGGTNVASPTEEQSNDMQVIILLQRTGRYDEAEARCIQILEQKPNDQTAKRLLAEIQAARHSQKPWADLKRRLQECIIPELNVRDAAVIDVIEFLREQSRTPSGDQAPINLVWQAPEDAKAAKITLNLRKIPLADVLKYVTESAGLRYRVDPHAVVIYKPLPTAPKDATPPNAKP